MSVTRQPNEEQTAHWNDRGGRAWAELQELLDGVLQPFQDHLLNAVSAGRVGRVLDVGCGTGSTTLAIARLRAADSQVVGVDISEPMLAAARERAAREGSTATFLRADAQTYSFDAGAFDMIVSRFGVMFFEDPVAAFGNLRRAATPGAELRFVAWRSPEENPFMTTAERAAAKLLANVPPRIPDAPGQFAFADPRRVSRILEESGWVGVDVQPLDVTCTLPEQGLVRYFTRLGPLGAILQELDDDTRAKLVATLRRAFDAYVDGTLVRFTAACWSVGARAPSATSD